MNLLKRKKELIEAKINLLKPKYRHLEFMKRFWQKPQEPLIVGFHTETICKAIDEAITRYNSGISTFLQIKISQRHGKSDMVSRYLPAHFIGLFPDSEVLNVSYSSSLASNFSKFGRRLLQISEFNDMFEGVELSSEKKAANDWEIQKNGKLTNGRVYARGLQSGMTGGGYHLGILDDYCAGRANAESQVQRDSMWDSFTNDFLTRRAPVSITIVLGTQWHEDDIHGRVQNRNNKEHKDYDKDFPKFKMLSFPSTVKHSSYARKPMWREKYKYIPGTKIEKTYLFQERFGVDWYKSMYAGLGPYAASAMMDCNPIPREGGLINTSKINFYEDNFDSHIARTVQASLTWVRVWDFAHSTKTKTNKNPDFTGGTLLAYRTIGWNQQVNQPICELFIKHYIQFKDTAVKRDSKIVEQTKGDGLNTQMAMETSLDSKDSYFYLQERLNGVKNIYPIQISIGKVARVEKVTPMFEAGNVHVLRDDWNSEWMYQLRRFDGSQRTHDEAVDNITAGYEFQVVQNGQQALEVTFG